MCDINHLCTELHSWKPSAITKVWPCDGGEPFIQPESYWTFKNTQNDKIGPLICPYEECDDGCFGADLSWENREADVSRVSYTSQSNVTVLTWTHQHTLTCNEHTQPKNTNTNQVIKLTFSHNMKQTKSFSSCFSSFSLWTHLKLLVLLFY